MSYPKDRIIRAYEVAMRMNPDHKEAVRVIAAIFGLDAETVREVVEEREGETCAS